MERFGYNYRYQHHPNGISDDTTETKLLSFPASSHGYKAPAPKLHPIDEAKLRDTKNSIVSIYNNALDKQQSSNITSKQREAIKELRSDPNIILLQVVDITGSRHYSN